MANNKDDIQIKVSVDTSDAKKELKEFEKSSDKMAKSVVKDTNEMNKAQEQLEQELRKVNTSMKDAFKNVNINGLTKAMKNVQNTVSKTVSNVKNQLQKALNIEANVDINTNTTTSKSDGANKGGSGMATALAGSAMSGGAIGSQIAKELAQSQGEVAKAVDSIKEAFGRVPETIQKDMADTTSEIVNTLKEVEPLIYSIFSDGDLALNIDLSSMKDLKGLAIGMLDNLKANIETINSGMAKLVAWKEKFSARGEDVSLIEDDIKLQQEELDRFTTSMGKLQNLLNSGAFDKIDFATNLDTNEIVVEIDRLLGKFEEIPNAMKKADIEPIVEQFRLLQQAMQSLGYDTSMINNVLTEWDRVCRTGSEGTIELTNAIKNARTYVTGLNQGTKQLVQTQIQQVTSGKDVVKSQQKSNSIFKQVTSLYDNITSSLKRLVAGYKSVSKGTEQLAKANKNLSTSFKSLMSSMAPYLSIAVIFGTLKSSITSYIDSLQDSSKFGLVFGSEAQNMTDWLNNLNSTVTTSKGTLMDFSSNLFRMGRNMGATTDDSIAMAKSMTELGADLVAFTNDANSIEALAGALRGEYDSLQNYGYALDAASVEAEAMALGLDTASESALLFARQSLILKQSAEVLGYGAAQAQTLGGQLQMLQKNFQALGASIGACFAGLLQVVLPVLNSIVVAVTSAFNKIASVINSIFGLFGIKVGGGSASGGGTVGGVIGDAVGGISDALGSGLDSASGGAGDVADSLADGAESAKELKKYLAGVDELNLTPEKSQPSGGSGSGSSGGSGSGAGAGGLGGLGDAVGGVATETESAADKVKDEIGEVADWIVKLVDNLKSVWNALKTGFLSVSDYINTSIANLKQAFINLGNSIQDFLLGAWRNGGEQLVYNFGRLGGALTGAIIDIAGQCVQMASDLFEWLNPDTNPYTRMFIAGLNNLLVACQNFALSVGGWFKTFVDNGGQAFLNVMGDILMILGTTLANTLANVINWVTLFMNSWAGQLLIEGVALALNLVAGAVKAVMVVIEKLTPLWSALLLAFGLKSGISTAITLFGKLGSKLVDFGLTIAANIEDVVVWGKNIVLAAKDAIKNFGSKLKDGYKHLKDFAKNLKDNIKKVIEWNKSHTKNWDDVKKGWKNFVTNIKDRIKAIGIHLKDGITKLKNWCKDWKTHLNTLKATISTKLNSIKTAFTNNWSAIKTWGANTVKMVVDTVKKAAASFATWVSSLTLANVWTGICTAATWLLNGALAVLTSPITWIIAAIVALIAIIKKVGDHFNWWTKIMDWLKEKCGWLYDGIMKVWEGAKSFFGWKAEENGIEDETNDAGDALNGLGDTMEEVSDRFGTATSAINESLSSIGIDSNKLALQLDEAEAMFNEKFGMISANAKEYLDAVTSGNEDMLSQMAGDADKYLAEIQSAFNDMSVAEQAVFYATYGEINGVTDGWLDYTKGSYEEALIKHTGMLESIKNNENLTYDEKLKRIDEEKEAFKTAQDEKLAALETTIAEINAQEWQSEEDRYNAVRQYSDERDKLIAEMEEYQLGSIDTIDEAVKTSAKTQEDAYNNVGESQEQALEGVSTALEETKTDLSSFKEESDKVAKEIPEAWTGIGETISEEFDEASNEVVKSLNTMNTKVKGQADTLKTTLKSAFAAINDGTKKSMTTMTNNIKQAFDKMSNNIKTQMQQIATELQARFTQINNGLNKSFTTMSTQVVTVLKNMATQISSSLKGVETTFKTSMNNISNVAKTKMQEACKTITTKVEAMKQPITNSFNGIKTNVGNSLDGLNKTVTNKMQVVLNTVKRFATQLQNATNFTFKTPYMKMPHINVHGDWNFEKKTTPSFSVRWYSDGGIFNKRSLIGVGDKYHGIGNNAEAVVPLDSMYKNIRNIVKEENKANTGDTRPITITLNMDGKELARGTVNSMKDLARIGALDLSFL